MGSEDRKGIHKKFLLELPWIEEIEPTEVCQGLIQKRVALKHVYSMGGRPPEGIPDKARCKYKARYHYLAIENGTEPEGNYCAWHAGSALFHTQEEMERYMKWKEENGQVRITPPTS
jgi:hypothetical protein